MTNVCLKHHTTTPSESWSTNEIFIFLRHTVAACVSTIITETVISPIDRVKLILQVQAFNKKSKSTSKRFKTVEQSTGIIDCFRKIIQRQGVLSLWRGHTAYLLQVLPKQAFTFALKDRFTTMISNHAPYDIQLHPMHPMMAGSLGGALAGVCMTLCLYPLDLARTRIATDLIQTKGKNMTMRARTLRCISEAYQRQGIKGVYSGLGFSLVGVITYRSFYFGIFDMRLAQAKDKNEGILGGLILPAFAASTIASFISYPIDTVRRTMIIRNSQGEPTMMSKRSPRRIAMKIYTKSGIKGFYYGALANLFRSIGGAIMLVAYTTIKNVADDKAM